MVFDFCIPEAQKLADLTGIKLDLKSALTFCELHIEIDPEAPDIDISELLRGEYTRQGLSRAAIITYGRCWGSGVRKSLPENILIKLSPASKIIHQQVIDIRNKWAAHSVNHFDEVKVFLQINEGTSFHDNLSVTVHSHSVAGFRRDFMIPMKTLCEELLALVEAESALESEKVTELARGLSKDEIMRLSRIDGVQASERLFIPTKVAPRFKPK